MIPLHRKQFPSSKAEVREALEEAFHRYVNKPGAIVEVSSRVFPYLDEIAINLDGARSDDPPPPPPALADEGKPAFEAAAINLSGRNVSVRGVPLDLRMEARDVVLYKACDEHGDAVLILQNVRDGSFTISAAQLDLEAGIMKLASQEGRKHGVVIEQVRLAMRARSARSVAADVRIKARKLLLRAQVDIYGQLEVSENFVVKVSELRCKSDNAVGGLVCRALNPLFQELNGKSFPLQSLPLREVRLRNVRFAVADTVEITIDFGGA
jgi:hypothetical protein